MTYSVTCLPGLSELLQQELSQHGVQASVVSPAVVQLSGGLNEALKVCLFSRLAERVLRLIDEEPGLPPNSLEPLAERFDPRHLSKTTSLWVQADHLGKVAGDARITGSVFKRLLGDPLPAPASADQGLCLRLLVTEEKTSLFVDLVGEPLGRRGYRLATGMAPVRETLAAAMALLALKELEQRKGDVLLDPFCGSGTLLLEAAAMSQGIAPALDREQFSFFYWSEFDEGEWQTLRQSAKEIADNNTDKAVMQFKGFDADERRIREANGNAERAGLSKLIHFERRELARLQGRDLGDAGVVITNPPWGERLEERAVAAALHMGLGRILAAKAENTPVVLLGSDVEVMDRISGVPSEHFRLRNGALTNYIRVVTPQKKSTGSVLLASEPAFEIPPQAQDLANRLRKNAKQLRKYLEQENVQAYRLYDRDLPEFNFSIDVYGDQVLVQEYKPPKTVDEKKAEQRRGWAVSAVRSILNAHREQVHLRTRQQQKGKSQYQKLAKRKKMHVIGEGQGLFLVNLESYLDSGLFLDHRPVRLRIAQESAGKRFLNLFAYTGSATVHAALGGAKSSVTVDASNTYLGWASENLALNGFGSRHHRVERADAMKWLEQSHDQFDLIFCDPPTFSNSKNRDDFTVQRDHGDLIRLAMRRLEPGGVLYFSCNFKRFELDRDVSIQFDVKNLSRGSVPPDFQRHQDIHYLFSVRHREK